MNGNANAFGTSTTPQALAVDIIEAANLLRVSVTTIRREINRGNLMALRIGRVFRIRNAELHAYLQRAEQSENAGKRA